MNYIGNEKILSVYWILFKFKIKFELDVFIN